MSCLWRQVILRNFCERIEAAAINTRAIQSRGNGNHAIVGIIGLAVSVLLAALQLKYQSSTSSPFHDHPKPMAMAITSFLLFCLGCDMEQIYFRTTSRASTFGTLLHHLVRLMAFISLASLTFVIFSTSTLSLVVYLIFPLLFSASACKAATVSNPFNYSNWQSGNVMEFVSSHDQDLGEVTKYCDSFEERGLYLSGSPSRNIPKYAIPEMDHLLEVVCQTFHLPLAQYHWKPISNPQRGSSIRYSPQYQQCMLELYLPSQKMDSYYPQNLLSSLLSTMKEHLPEYLLASGENLGQVISVKVIKSFTPNEHESLKIVDKLEEESYVKCIEPQSLTSKPARSEEILEDEGYAEEIDHYALEMTLEEVSKLKKHSVTNVYYLHSTKMGAKFCFVDGFTEDELLLGPIIEDVPYATSNVEVGCATSNVDIRNSMTTASQTSRFQTKKMLYQQEEEATNLEIEGDISQQLFRISKPFFEDGTEQDDQVSEIKKSTPNICSCEEISTVDEFEEELPIIKCNEPQSLTSQSRRFEEIFGDEIEGYRLASERVENLVELSPNEAVEYAVTTASKRLKKSKIPLTAENIIKHFGRPLKDAAESFGVSPSTLKRRCRSVGITRWPPSKRKAIDNGTGKSNFSSSTSPLQDMSAISHRSQALEKMTVKATYNDVTIKFELTNLSGISELEDNVIKRLRLGRNKFSIKYLDNDNELILIGYDSLPIFMCYYLKRKFVC
ncbi:hypothetical protein POM88_002644 [Heracleum sosnowskyi]|uniref:RWP-RK domain-containing protein n=1 Tax=Heracleum sosnowskyi TaxID=360622 RepID=A0AAD8NAN9_9APIA|nr:hypothetical protein POM88_002644 [Heracleum sosnowskyi]